MSYRFIATMSAAMRLNWEGNTLVVEATNFRMRQPIAIPGRPCRHGRVTPGDPLNIATNRK